MSTVTQINTSRIFTFAGLTFNEYKPNCREGIPKHVHDYQHMTLVVAGKLCVRKEGIEVILTPADLPVVLKANEWHELEAIEDGTVFLNVFNRVMPS